MTDLPGSLPIFPLPGALLLPGGQLPLNIFEPRYVAMVEDALKGDRLIGIIQPKAESLSCGTPLVHDIGCAGKITEHAQKPDGGYTILLSGISRFKVEAEWPPLRGYRRVTPAWIEEPPVEPKLDRVRLMPALKRFLGERGLNCDWSAADRCPDSRLVTTLAMICPFTLAEQQALLEAEDAAARGALLTSLLVMSCPDCAKPN